MLAQTLSIFFLRNKTHVKTLKNPQCQERLVKMAKCKSTTCSASGLYPKRMDGETDKQTNKENSKSIES